MGSESQMGQDGLKDAREDGLKKAGPLNLSSFNFNAEFTFGQKVKDKYTDFAGTISAVCFHEDRSTEYCVELWQGQKILREWIAEDRLEVRGS